MVHLCRNLWACSEHNGFLSVLHTRYLYGIMTGPRIVLFLHPPQASHATVRPTSHANPPCLNLLRNRMHKLQGRAKNLAKFSDTCSVGLMGCSLAALG